MALLEASTESRFLTWTDWGGYELFLRALENRRVRITYDRGRLELLSPSILHERLKKLLDRLVAELLDYSGGDFCSAGSTTLRRQLLDRGLEPDECYFTAHRHEIGPDYDLETGPPPDLVLEIEVSRSCLDRLGIYQALGVPEIWRFGPDIGIVVMLLDPQGYRASPASPTFPGLPLDELPRFAQVGLKHGDAAMLRVFRRWLAKLPWPAPTTPAGP